MNAEQILKRYYGYESFRGGQQELVNSILSGRDTLGVMPTGAGKSVCYQIPAIMMSGITLVISPLISLMQDQVSALRQSGIPAAYYNSSLSSNQQDAVIYNAQRGMYKLIYVAPERLEKQSFLDFACRSEISMVTVDEAHCISQWGQDFRPSYLNIPRFINALPSRPVVSAFTATATAPVREDISRCLELNEPFVKVTGFDRANLFFGVRHPKEKISELKRLIKKYLSEERSGIVYCATRRDVDNICEKLNVEGIPAVRYHAGLSEEERRTAQEDFRYDRVKLMIATNAFGMGIDKSNITFVIHYSMPKDIESYYQEAGRAGRDGSPSDCILLYSGRDVVTAKWLINNSSSSDELIPEQADNVKGKALSRLNDMINYCNCTDCLRSRILRYFGESSAGNCGNCSSCCSEEEQQDITVDAQKIMSCIYRTGQRYGISIIADVLRGAKSDRIIDRGLDKVTTYGIMSECSNAHIRQLCDCLISLGYIEKSDDDYRVLKLSKSAAAVLKGKVRVYSRLPKDSGRKKADRSDYDTALMSKLRKLRADIARSGNVPAYIIFNDETLREMCRVRPVTDSEFRNITGVGERKLERYGTDFMRVIADHIGGDISSAVRDNISSGDSGDNVDVYEYDPQLMKRLKTIREQLAASENVPVHKIVSDLSLREMCDTLPAAEEELINITGIGPQKLRHYGSDFLKAIALYRKDNSPRPVGRRSSHRPTKGYELQKGLEEICSAAGSISPADEDITLSMLADKILADTGVYISGTALQKRISDWLVGREILYTEKGSQKKRPVQSSSSVGVYEDKVFNQTQGAVYSIVKYTPAAQQMILDNMAAIASLSLSAG